MKSIHWPQVVGVTGTDTDVGKTVVSAVLVQGLQGAYWKPIQSGLEPATDTERVREVTGGAGGPFFPEAYRLRTPASPHLAAALDGVTIDLSSLELPKVEKGRYLVVEGAGGVLVPLNDQAMMVDLFAHLQIPVVLVCRTTLGTLNHTLLSLEALRRRAVPILGVVMNGVPHEENRKAIEGYGKVPVLATLPPLESFDQKCVEQAFWEAFGEPMYEAGKVES